MANEHFFPGADFSGLAAPFSGAFMAPIDAAAFGLPWAVDQPADSSATAATAAAAAHFDSALSSLVSSPVTTAGDEDVSAIGDLIGRLGSICNSGVASANTSCYSTPLSSPPHAAAAFPGAVARVYGTVLETGRLSRVSSSKSLGAAAAAGGTAAFENSAQAEAEMSSKISSPELLAAGEGNARKRKASAKGGKAKDSSLAITVATARNDASPKRSKIDGDKADDGSAAEGNAEESNGNADANAAAPEPPRGYIHVRARRGQATDSHSLAERVRRERISERMKMLQSLVPGCNKITGKALMLDEIINYVRSLQRQVEFLSMKLATMNSHFDSPNGHYLQSKDIHQTEMPIHPENSRTTTFSYAGHPGDDPFATAHHQVGGAFWEQDLQSVVWMGTGHNREEMTAAAAALPLQTFSGQAIVNHMKVEP